MDPPIERHGFLRTASLSGGVQTPPLRDRSPLLKEIIIFTCYGLPSLNGGVQTPPLRDSILRKPRRKKKYWRHKARPGPGPAQARPGPGLNRPSKITRVCLRGVQVALFGLKLCENDAPDLRIILEALLGPKTLFKHPKKPKNIKIPSFTVNN